MWMEYQLTELFIGIILTTDPAKRLEHYFIKPYLCLAVQTERAAVFCHMTSQLSIYNIASSEATCVHTDIH